jgi:hypothetical protein
VYLPQAEASEEKASPVLKKSVVHKPDVQRRNVRANCRFSERKLHSAPTSNNALRIGNASSKDENRDCGICRISALNGKNSQTIRARL